MKLGFAVETSCTASSLSENDENADQTNYFAITVLMVAKLFDVVGGGDGSGRGAAGDALVLVMVVMMVMVVLMLTNGIGDGGSGWDSGGD